MSEKILYVAGIGPGGREYMTEEAFAALREADVIAGYSLYADLVRPHFPDKEYLVTGMRKERERCLLALQSASEGKRTVLISGGDAAVYGMAGLVLELAEDFPEVDVQVIAGVTAALAGSAVLGAPLFHFLEKIRNVIRSLFVDGQFFAALGFKYIGAITIYSHLQACGVINDHARACPCFDQINIMNPIVELPQDDEVGQMQEAH